ncbi:hypothetical protein ACS0TY_027845 [Phlomoides rotata]
MLLVALAQAKKQSNPDFTKLIAKPLLFSYYRNKVTGPASRGNARCLKLILDTYADLSGQVFNPDKSKAYFGKHVSTQNRAYFRSTLHIGSASLPFIYLGVPLFRGAHKAAHLRILADRITTKFAGWKGSALSMAGRVCLVNSVIVSSLVHSMMQSQQHASSAGENTDPKESSSTPEVDMSQLYINKAGKSKGWIVGLGNYAKTRKMETQLQQERADALLRQHEIQDTARAHVESIRSEMPRQEAAQRTREESLRQELEAQRTQMAQFQRMMDQLQQGQWPSSPPAPPTRFHIRSIPSSIFNLSSLNVLSLGKRFSLYNLEKLYLDENRLSGEIPSFISSNASKLTILTLSNNSLSGPFPDFGNLRLLQTLYIWGNQLTGELTFLSSLSNCRYLEDLEIDDNPLNGCYSTRDRKLEQLDRFKFRHKSDYRTHPKRNVELQELQGLNLSNNHLQGDISTNLCKMSNLGDLDLSVNMLTGAIPDCLGEVKSLRNVYIHSNKLESNIPSNLWNLRDLLILQLDSNSLSGQLSSQIGNLKQIYRLDLSSNQFLGDIPTTIVSCESLEYLSLSNNKLQGSIPKSLGNVRGLTTLDLSREIPNGIINSTAQSFVHNSALCGAAKFQVPPCVNDRGRSRSTTIALICLKYVVPPFVAATIIVVVVLMFLRRHKQIIIHQAADISLETFVGRRVSYIELVRGTSSFSKTNLLGIGSFGSVYKATLSDGLIIAAKVFNLELEGATTSFDTESEILSSIRHRNLLPVISCCTNQEFRALILKYMPNGNQEKWLHSVNNLLDLVQRLNIAIDVALALEYLHHHHTFPVVHCDIKPSNVLLDEDMTAHVADFGISKLFDEGEVMTHTTTLATIGYAAPEYGFEGKVSTKGDVYSYGIMLLEMFTRKKPTDDMFDGHIGLKEWVSEAVERNAISEVVDHALFLNEECMSSVFDLAMKCLAISPGKRINMIQAATALQRIKDNIVNNELTQKSSPYYSIAGSSPASDPMSFSMELDSWN